MTQAQDSSAAQAIAQAVSVIDESSTMPETLDAIVRATLVSIPQFEHVSISLRDRHGTIETATATGQLAWDLDAVQYELGEGPCVDAIEREPVVVVQRVPHEQRWPRYIQAAIERGVRSQVGVQLFARGKHLGGLNLYSTEHEEVDDESAQNAHLFAVHAAVMLGHAQEEHHLNQALHSRKKIGQAIGILMERYRIDEHRAFQFLLRASSTSNTKLRDVADELVRSTTEAPQPQP